MRTSGPVDPVCSTPEAAPPRGLVLLTNPQQSFCGLRFLTLNAALFYYRRPLVYLCRTLRRSGIGGPRAAMEAGRRELSANPSFVRQGFSLC